MDDGGGNGAGCFEVKIYMGGYSEVHERHSSKI